MKLPVYVASRRAIVHANCSAAVFAAFVVARGLAYVCIVAAAMLLPRRIGIIVGGVAAAYVGAVAIDGLVPMAFLWAGLIHLPEEEVPRERYVCWCASCTATRAGEAILSLAALRNDGGDSEGAAELRGLALRLDTMFPETMHGDHARHVDRITGADSDEQSPPTKAEHVQCLATEVASDIRLLAEFKGRVSESGDSDEAQTLQSYAEHIQAMFDPGPAPCAQCGTPCDGDPRSHQGPCARDGLFFCSTLCSMNHKRGGE